MIDPLVKSPLLASTFCLMHPPTWIRQCRCAVSPSDDTAIISWRQQLKRRWGQGIGYTKHLRRKIGRLKVEVPKNGETMKYTYSNFMYRWLWYIVMQDVDSLKIVQEKIIGSIVDFRSLCELMHASLCQHPCLKILFRCAWLTANTACHDQKLTHATAGHGYFCSFTSCRDQGWAADIVLRGTVVLFATPFCFVWWLSVTMSHYALGLFPTQAHRESQGDQQSQWRNWWERWRVTTQKGRIKTLGVTHFRRQLPLSQDCLSFLESVVECEFFETVPSFEQLPVISCHRHVTMAKVLLHRHVTMAKVLLVPLHVTLRPSFSAVFASGSSTYRGPWQIWVGSSRVRHCGWEWDENIEERWRKAVSSCMFWIRCMNEGGQFCDAQKHGMESKSPNIEPPCPKIWVQSCPWCFSRARGQTTTSAQNVRFWLHKKDEKG